jgi:hypothetical protein
MREFLCAYCIDPLTLVVRALILREIAGRVLPRKHIDTVDAEFARRLLLRCCAEAIKARCYMDRFQANPLQIIDQLCLRQSPGNSTCPQIDIAADILREFIV